MAFAVKIFLVAEVMYRSKYVMYVILCLLMPFVCLVGFFLMLWNKPRSALTMLKKLKKRQYSN